MQALWCQPKCFQAMGDYLLTLERDGALIGRIAPLRDIPVVVISSGDQSADRLAAHRNLAEASIQGRQVIASRSAHWVQFDEPQLIIEVIKDLVASLRMGDGADKRETPGVKQCLSPGVSQRV